jgi:hypothetical protein
MLRLFRYSPRMAKDRNQQAGAGSKAGPALPENEEDP